MALDKALTSVAELTWRSRLPIAALDPAGCRSLDLGFRGSSYQTTTALYSCRAMRAGEEKRGRGGLPWSSASVSCQRPKYKILDGPKILYRDPEDDDILGGTCGQVHVSIHQVVSGGLHQLVTGRLRLIQASH
jgi:hypothetical protein